VSTFASLHREDGSLVDNNRQEEPAHSNYTGREEKLC